ncbi:unnamed protein product [Auanema sp. JU1783]|nr:unnamed protein product [Auanema sp. JU1783]
MARYIILLAIVGLCLAADEDVNGANVCEEYLQCLEKAQTRLSECGAEAEKEKKVTCEDVKKLGDELHGLQEQKASAIATCVKDKASTAEVLTGRKAKKCSAALLKLKRAPTDAKREKRQGKKKEKKNSCVKDAKKFKSQCSKIAKCCSAVKVCNTEYNSEDIVSKKSELKEAFKVCKEKNGGNKKQGRRGGKKVQKSESGSTTAQPIA